MKTKITLEISSPLVYHWSVNGKWVSTMGFTAKRDIIKDLQKYLKKLIKQFPPQTKLNPK